MARRDKLIAKMRTQPRAIDFREVDALLRYEGFVIVNRRGSHFTYHHANGTVVTVVRPHGKRRTCHPSDIKRVLEALRL